MAYIATDPILDSMRQEARSRALAGTAGPAAAGRYIPPPWLEGGTMPFSRMYVTRFP